MQKRKYNIGDRVLMAVGGTGELRLVELSQSKEHGIYWRLVECAEDVDDYAAECEESKQ